MFLFKFGLAVLFFKHAESNLLHISLKHVHTCDVTQLNVLNYVAVHIKIITLILFVLVLLCYTKLSD